MLFFYSLNNPPGGCPSPRSTGKIERRRNLDNDCNKSCSNLIECFEEIAFKLSNNKEKEALYIAQNLKPNMTDLNCTQPQIQQISNHISSATKTASKLGESLSSVVREAVSELISTLGIVLAANEDLIKLSKLLFNNLVII